MSTEKVTRFEVIDHREGGNLDNRGRVFVTGIDKYLQVHLSFQDEGRTLKVFLETKKE